MDESIKSKTIMECALNYSLIDGIGQVTAGGEAKAGLKEDSLSILPKLGETLFLSLRDIIEVSEGDYKLYLNLTSNEKITLSNLGYQFEDFSRVLFKLCNELMLKDMLMQEKLKKSGVAAEFADFDENGKEKQRGNCQPQLYETAVVIIPEKGELIRIPYSDISEIHEADYTLTLSIESGEKFVFSKMGWQFDSVKKTLSDLMNELSLAVQASLKELLPQADPSLIRKAARLMKDGKAVGRSAIELISTELWEGLEKKLGAVGIKEEYDFLKSLAQQQKMCIGFKRGLMGGSTSEYIWFLIPIYSTNASEPGNAVAMEATSDEGGGKATYFFRLVSRRDYSNFKTIEDLHRTADNFIEKMNRCMLTINFRREPIYLSDEKLEDPQYQKYKFAIAKIPALRELRQFFIGRVIHVSPEQWQKDVASLLKFNVSTQDDDDKWKQEEIKDSENNEEGNEKGG